MSSKEVVLVHKITKQQNAIDFSVIENSLLKKKNKITIRSVDLKLKASKIVFNNLHGYAYDFCGGSILKDAGTPSKLVIEKVTEYVILVFIYYNPCDSNINEVIAEMKNNHCLGIDLGKKNTFAIVNNFGKKPILIKGTMMAKLYNENIKLFNEYLEGAIRFIEDYIDKNDIKTIYVGNMYRYKPYDIIINRLKKIKKIKVVVVNEANTSKASFLDNDILNGEWEFSGKRLTRSQYISKNGTVFDADINAAYNIMIVGNPFALYESERPQIEPVNHNIQDL